ncbi:cation diffusion facilitator family transporter [Alkalispirillum mobile]|uniref:Cation diffusion facilitator family transporter n=1 Tax=Alkalispirillum mobile TaxID=85925 RepID=A0A498CEK0_9GAMM|nr:cation diffusion facilitator family transporter [Alkalispirillum mobile]RLK50858.1 cation diffusion facilitator family transporter [Alkalispirillum mobile]
MISFWARENTALKLSAAIAGLFALGGVGWGLWINSLVILFDGAYSLVSLVLTLLSVYAARVVRKPANQRFPFGRGAIEPLVITVKGLTITLICLLSMASAVHALLTGGRLVEPGLAMAFAGISVLACALVWGYLRWAQRHVGSGLVTAERRQWLMDTVLSLAVLLGFGLAAALERTHWGDYAAYADPAMVLLVAGYFIVVPMKMTSEAVRELVLAAPPAELQARVAEALAKADVPAEQARSTKMGPYLLLEIRLPADRMPEITRLRIRLYRLLSGLSVRPVVIIHPEARGPRWRDAEPLPTRRGAVFPDRAAGRLISPP